MFVYDHCEALETARVEGKPMLILFSMPENTSVQWMMETTFCDEEIKNLAERFVCAHVDASQALELCKQLEIVSFPTILLSNSNGTEIRRLIGKHTSDELAVQMHVVLQKTALLPTSVR